MRKLPALLLMVVTLSLSYVPVHADKPPFPKSLAERVNLATHVFVGKAKRVRVGKVVAGRLRRVRPEPTHTGTASGVVVELEVEVREILFPVRWNPSKTVRIFYGGGIFSVKDLRKAFLAESFVYLTRMGSVEGGTYFGPSYPWHLVEKLGKREEIKSILEKRGDRQGETYKRLQRTGISLPLIVSLPLAQLSPGRSAGVRR